MTISNNPDHSTTPPDAAVVHLSGRRRGTTEFLSGDHIVIPAIAEDGVEMCSGGSATAGSLAILDRRGHTFRLTVTPGAEA